MGGPLPWMLLLLLWGGALSAAPLVLCTDGPQEPASVARLAAGFDAAQLQHRSTERCPKRGDRGRFVKRGGAVRFVLTAANGAQITRAMPLRDTRGPLAALARDHQLDDFRLRLFGLLLDAQMMPAPKKPEPKKPASKRPGARRPKRRPPPKREIKPPKRETLKPETNPAAAPEPSPPLVLGPPPPPEPAVEIPPELAARPAVPTVVPPKPRAGLSMGALASARWREPGILGLELGLGAGWGPWRVEASVEPNTPWTTSGRRLRFQAAGARLAWAPTLIHSRYLRLRVPVWLGGEWLGLRRLDVPGALHQAAALQLGLGMRLATTSALQTSLGFNLWLSPTKSELTVPNAPQQRLNRFGASLGLGLGWGP